MSVYFHSNFRLNRERLAGILNYLIENPELNDEQIGKKYGYKAPFTKRYKSWLKKCGIIENSIKVKLTEFGKIIYKKDPKLKKQLSMWYMHSYLSSSEDIGEAWNFFYHTYLPKNKIFKKTELSDALSMKLMAHDTNHFAKNAPMIKVITKILIDSYISEAAFGPLGIVEFKKESLHRGRTNIPYKWNSVKTFEKLY